MAQVKCDSCGGIEFLNEKVGQVGDMDIVILASAYYGFLSPFFMKDKKEPMAKFVATCTKCGRTYEFYG